MSQNSHIHTEGWMQSTEEITTQLVERLDWHTDRCDESQVARRSG
jgi:hypothetical protein